MMKRQFLRWLILIFAFFAEIGFCSVFYEYSVVAQTGVADVTGIQNGVSINESGNVAFVGSVAGGQALFVGDSSSLTNLTPSFVSSSLTFSRYVQINNLGFVLARDRVSSNYSLRLWDEFSPDNFEIVARGGSSSTTSDFASVFGQGSINDNPELELREDGVGNEDGVCDVGESCGPQVALTGLTFGSLDDFVASANKYAAALSAPSPKGEFNSLALDIPVFPMIGDDGSIVMRAGTTTADPITLYDYGLRGCLKTYLLIFNDKYCIFQRF